MNESAQAGRWRNFAFRLAVLCLIWLLLATTFAAQFYWIGKDLPLQISWKDSFLHALVEWCPWMLLSPAVMWLAERCQFDRTRRLWGLLPHLLGCLLMALAYQGISTLLTPRQAGVFFQTSLGNGHVIGGSSGMVRSLGTGMPFSREAPAPGIFSARSDEGTMRTGTGGGGFGPGRGGVSVEVRNVSSGPSGAVQVIRSDGPLPEKFALPFPPEPPGTAVRFLQVAVTRAQSTVPIYWAIVCVTWVISYYRQLRERERRTLELEARLTQANLQALRTQLQPHFLFNTLNAIASLVRRQPDAAEDMIGSLSDFLRLNLDIGSQHEVPLRREIEGLDLYLEIQQIRFGERLRIKKEIDPAALDVPVPTLLLQPLVENSVRHGIEPRESGGTIWIRANRQENVLRLEVRDDGEGLKGGQLVAIREGIGLSNTKARLQQLYGAEHRFQIMPHPEGGLTVTVELPWREKPA